jgi:hypothetical protein
MASLTTRISMTDELGVSIHVTVYDEDLNELDPVISPVTWSGLLDTTTVEADSTGYNFSSTVAGSDVVTATRGLATATFTLTWTAKPLRFSSP